MPDGSFDYDGIRAAIHEKTKLVTIQRSKGYATRPSFSVEEIGQLIAFCKSCKPGIICMVDNCYGELVETTGTHGCGGRYSGGQPHQESGRRSGSHRRLCLPAGRICIDRCAYRLSAPGLGKEVGANLGLLTSFYQGLFLAPTVVGFRCKGCDLYSGML